MTALPFATRVICYCLGQGGSLSLRGHRKRLWLKLRRSELERTYLDHQVRSLRRLNTGEPFEVHWSRVATDAVYDDLQAEFTCEDLWGAYRLLYPRDQRQVTPEAIGAAGLPGLAAAFLDDGVRAPKSAKLRFYGPMPQPVLVNRWLEGLAVPGRVRWFPGGSIALQWDKAQSETLIHFIRPLVHRSMAHRLAAPKLRTRTFYAGL